MVQRQAWTTTRLLAMARRVPDAVRHLTIYGVPYFIQWERLMPGHSFFLKTTASAAEVTKQLGRAEKHYRITLRAHNRCEFGFYGVRVWRIA